MRAILWGCSIGLGADPGEHGKPSVKLLVKKKKGLYKSDLRPIVLRSIPTDDYIDTSSLRSDNLTRVCEGREWETMQSSVLTWKGTTLWAHVSGTASVVSQYRIGLLHVGAGRWPCSVPVGRSSCEVRTFHMEFCETFLQLTCRFIIVTF